MRKILVFSALYYPYVGGAEVAIKEITDRIDPADIEFHLVTLRVHSGLLPYEKIGNLHVYRIGFWNTKDLDSLFSKALHQLNKYFFTFFGCALALRLHKKHNFNATWAVMASYGGFAALFFKWFKPNIPFILTLQEGDTFKHIKRRVSLLYPLLVQIFKNADKMQTISHYLADFGKRMGYVGDSDPLVIPNGVDVSLFTKEYTESDLKELKQHFSKTEKDIFLVTTSRLVEKNGLRDVISALPLLSAHISFLILGVGHLESRLKEQAKELGVEKRVHFIGFVNHADIPKYLKISDIFIRPSLSEGMGNSFVEAMAAGLPVIATPVGGIPDIVTDRETGVFCQPEDPESIAKAVNLLMKDSELKESIISKAKAFSSSFDWKLIARRMEVDVFNKVF